MKQIAYKGKPASLILESRHDCKFVCESLDLQTPEGVLMRLKGTFAGPFDDTKNRNGRTYDFTNYYSQVQTLMPKIKKKSLLGELEHVKRRQCKYGNVSHRINEIEWDPTTSTFIGTIDILDTPSGRIAYGIAKAGSPLYISSRAIGVVDPKTGKTTLLKLVTYDLVCEPGFANAEFLPVGAIPINESICYVNESEDDDDWQDDLNESDNSDNYDAYGMPNYAKAVKLWGSLDITQKLAILKKANLSDTIKPTMTFANVTEPALRARFARAIFDNVDENEQNNQNINPMQNKNTFIAAYLSADASKLGFETIQKVESILDTVGCDYSDTGLGVAYDKLSVEDRQHLHKLLQIDYVTEGDNDGIANRWNGMTEHDREVLLAKVGIEDKDLAKKQFEDLCPEKVQPAISDFFKSNFANESLNLDYLNACWQALDDAAKSEILEEAKVDATVAETQNFSDIDEKQQKSIADAMVKLDKAQADMIELEDSADEAVGMPVWQAANENRRKALLKAAGITENIDDIVKTPWLALDNSIRAELNKINVVNESVEAWNSATVEQRLKWLLAKNYVQADAEFNASQDYDALSLETQNFVKEFFNVDESTDFNAGDWWFNAKESDRATVLAKVKDINVEDAVNATWEMFNDQSKAAIEGAIREAGLVTESEDNDIAKLWSEASQETREAAIKATGLAVEADIKWDELSEEQQATMIRVLANDEDNVFGKLKNAANSLQKTLDGVDDFDESFEDFVCEAMKYSKKAYNQVIDSMTVEEIVKIKSELKPEWGAWAKKMKDEDKYGNVTMSATHVRTLSDLGDAKAAAEYIEKHYADKLAKAGEQVSATQPGKKTKDTVKDGGKYTTISEFAKYKGKTVALDNAKVPGGWGKVLKVSEDGTMEVQCVNADNKKVQIDAKDFKDLNKKGKQQFKEWQQSQKAGAKDEALDENKRQWALLTIANVDYVVLKDIADKFDIEVGNNLATAVIAFTNELNMDEVDAALIDEILKHATVETTDEALSEKEVAEIWNNLNAQQREQAAREGLIDDADLKHVCANNFANQSKEHQSMIRTGMNIAGFIEECNGKHVNESIASDKLYQTFDNATRILIDKYFTPALIAKVQNLKSQGNSLSDTIGDVIAIAKASANDTHERAIESRRSEITKWLAALWQAEQVNESRIKFIPNKSMHIDEADKDDKPTQEDVNDMVDGLVDANIIKQQQKDELLDALADAEDIDKLNNKAALAEKVAEVANDLGFDVDVDDCMSMVNESAEDGVRNALLKDRGFDDFTFKTINRDGETYSVVVTKDDNQLVGIEVAGDMTENAQSTLASMLRTYLAKVNTDEALIEIRRAIKQINLDESRIEKLYTDKGLKVVDESLIDDKKIEPMWKSKMPQAYRLIFESLTDDQRDLVATQASVRTFVNEADVAAFFRSRNWNAIRNYQAQDRSTWVNESKIVDEGLNEHGLTPEQQALVDAIKG